MDTPSFYDIGVFNHSARNGYILSSIECWKDIHPSLVTIPIDWGGTIPYSLLYVLKPHADVLKVVEAIRAIQKQSLITVGSNDYKALFVYASMPESPSMQ